MISILLSIALTCSGFTFTAFAGAAEDDIEIVADKDYVVHYADEPSNEGWDSITGKELEQELKKGNIDQFEEDVEVTLFGDSEMQYEHDVIGLSSAESINALGQGITIAVIDSGVYPHVELKNNLLKGYNYINDNDDTNDVQGHGTAVAGIIAAELNGQGISGVAPKAKIIPLKCFSDSNTKISSVIRAIYDAVDKYNVDIINMSFGTPTHSDGLYEAVKYAKDCGVIMVAAVGNDGDYKFQYPAAYSEVIGVGGVTRSGEHVDTSQTNSSVFITAPSVAVLGTSNSGGYFEASGTSFATPIVTGAIADMICLDPGLYLENIKAILMITAIDKGDDGYDRKFGHGIVNLKGCIDTLLSDSEMFISPIDTTFDGKMTLDVYSFNDSGGSVMLLTEVENMETGETVALTAQEVELSEARAQKLPVVLPTEMEIDAEILDNISPYASRTLKIGDKNVNFYAVELDPDVIAVVNGEEPSPGGREDPTISFPDVADTDYFYEPVIWAAEKGITSGYGDGHFAPEMFCTRAQTVTFLWRAAGSPEPSGINPFKDVIEDDYYYKAVLWAVEKGITKGTSFNMFSPEAVVTRGQTVTFLNRSVGEPAVKGVENPFEDVRSGDYYYGPVLWAVSHKITNGMDEVSFSPDDSCTRGQIVTFLYRASKL